MTRPFGILSLDGGGVMGAFAAWALATFERQTNRRIVEHFVWRFPATSHGWPRRNGPTIDPKKGS